MYTCICACMYTTTPLPHHRHRRESMPSQPPSATPPFSPLHKVSKSIHLHHQTPQYPAYQTPHSPAYQTPQYPAYQTPHYPAYQTPHYPAYQTPHYPAYRHDGLHNGKELRTEDLLVCVTGAVLHDEVKQLQTVAHGVLVAIKQLPSEVH